METPTKITSLAQLAPRTSDYVITDSATGDEFTVTLRDLLPSDIAELDARRKRVKPKEIGFKGKDAYGVPIPILDDENPDYIKAVADANNAHVCEWLLLAWVVEYPADADTPEKKMDAIKRNVPFWAFNELARRMGEVTGLRMSDVAREKKRLRATNSENSNTAPAASGVGL